MNGNLVPNMRRVHTGSAPETCAYFFDRCSVRSSPGAKGSVLRETPIYCGAASLYPKIYRAFSRLTRTYLKSWASRLHSAPSGRQDPACIEPRTGVCCFAMLRPMNAGMPRRELVFGFVAPLGVEREKVTDALRKALDDAKYILEEIHLSDALHDFADKPDVLKHLQFTLERKKVLMDAGDTMRREWAEKTKPDRRADAVALAGIEAIRQKRQERNDELGTKPELDQDGATLRDLTQIPLVGVAYLLDSLKNPDELERLRSVYGPAFVSIGIYSPREMREKYLRRKALKADVDLWLDDLLERDARGTDDDLKLGQRVSDAFNQADFIVDATLRDTALENAMLRLVELLFGNVHLTPCLEELGMYVARAAQVRSGSLARQIGASILRDDGSVVAVGTNEVAKSITGGQYWPEDDAEYKGRDRVYHSVDTSDEFRALMVRHVLDRLASEKVLVEDYRDEKMSSATRLQALYGKKDSLLRGGPIAANIDYIRAVHAEAAALLDCARHGVAVRGTSMFTTTFPCHECSRHIVAAGIKRVVYLEPYPKSATRDLYHDSIAIDPAKKPKKKVMFTTFVGVAPARYLEFFAMGSRKRKDDDTGKPIDYTLSELSAPRLPYYTAEPEAIMYSELREVSPYIAFLADRKANREKEKDTGNPPNAPVAAH